MCSIVISYDEVRCAIFIYIVGSGGRPKYNHLLLKMDKKYQIALHWNKECGKEWVRGQNSKICTDFILFADRELLLVNVCSESWTESMGPRSVLCFRKLFTLQERLPDRKKKTIE